MKLPIRLLLESRTGDGVVASVGNFAPGGVFVKANNAPATGSKVELSFRMIANRMCKAIGQVVWSSDSGFGIAFEDTNEDMDRFTAQLLKLPAHLHLFYLADVLDTQLHMAQ